MRIKLFAALAAVFLLLPGKSIAAEKGDFTAEARNLISRIQAKVAEGKQTEKEFASELKEFDELIVKYKDEKADDVAQILYAKATLYLQVIGDSEKGAQTLNRIKRDFPETQAARNANQMLVLIKQQEEKAKIDASLVAGIKAPDFNEKDLEDKPLSLANHKGKVVLIDFWATWCGPCVAELPNVLSTYEKHHGQGFEIIGINLDNDRQKLDSFIKQKKIPWPQFFDGQAWDNKLAQKYGVQMIPMTYLLDGEGKIIAKNLRGKDLEAAVARALTKK